MIQNLARNEVNAIMQETGGQLTMAALQNLSYLERCLKEAMRLYPSVPNIMRISSEDVKLRKQIIKKNCIVMYTLCIDLRK